MDFSYASLFEKSAGATAGALVACLAAFALQPFLSNLAGDFTAQAALFVLITFTIVAFTTAMMAGIGLLADRAASAA